MPNEPDDLLAPLRDEPLDEQLLTAMRQHVVAQGGAMLRRRHWQGIALRVAAVLVLAIGAGWLYLYQNNSAQVQPVARVSTPNEPKPASQAQRNEPESMGRPQRNESKLVSPDPQAQRNKPKHRPQQNEPEPVGLARFVLEPARNPSRTVGDIPGESPHRYTGEPGRSVPSVAPSMQTALVLARNEPKPAQPQWEVASLQADGSAKLQLGGPKSDIVILWVTPSTQEGEQQP